MTTARSRDLVAQLGRPRPGAAALERLVEAHPELAAELDDRTAWPRRSWRCWPPAAASAGCCVDDPGALSMLAAARGDPTRLRMRPRRGGGLEAAGAAAHRGRATSRAASPSSTSTAALASMAAAVLERAHRRPTEHLAPDDRLAVIGMGKLGGASSTTPATST